MLKRLRRINKTHLIESSRMTSSPLPMAYATLLAAGVHPCTALMMTHDAATVKKCCDDPLLEAVVVWAHTKYPKDWVNAERSLQR